jgi:putative Mn2+ efflux pump MntP
LEEALRLSVLFGLFQAGMPLVGWICTNWLAERIEAYDHWIAFGLLVFLGGRMIRDAFSDEEEAHHFDPTNWWTGIVLAVATSIDALAVGISLAVTGYHTIRQLAMPLIAIGVGSFLFAMIGHWLGMRFGSSIRRRLQPELLGGIILIGIGVKVLVTHLAG